MPFYRVHMSSANYCGFDSYGFFEAKSESALESSFDFHEYQNEMQEYVSEWFTSEDYEGDDEADFIVYFIEEINEKEYLEALESMSGEKWHIG